MIESLVSLLALTSTLCFLFEATQRLNMGCLYLKRPGIFRLKVLGYMFLKFVAQITFRQMAVHPGAYEQIGFELRMLWADGERITSTKPLVLFFVLAQRPARDVGNEGARLRLDCGRHIVAGLPDDSLFMRIPEPAVLSTRPTFDTNRPHHRTGGRQETAELMRSAMHVPIIAADSCCFALRAAAEPLCLPTAYPHLTRFYRDHAGTDVLINRIMRRESVVNHLSLEQAQDQ